MHEVNLEPLYTSHTSIVAEDYSAIRDLDDAMGRVQSSITWILFIKANTGI